MEPNQRRTALFAEHVALGADMDAYRWAGMAMPWSYRTSLAEEQRAVRERAGLCDASQLQVVRVSGPGAVACLERLLPRRIGDMCPGTSRFSVVLSRFGRIFDEALILRLDEEEFWVCHGCGGTQQQLAKVGGEVQVEPLVDQHVLSIQGPLCLDALNGLTDQPLGDLPFLGHRRARIEGHAVLLSRTGFTGELGFEIFCDADAALPLWRALMTAGAGVGLIPYSYAAVDLLRIEAGFTLYPTDLGMAASIWEAGLGWLVKEKGAEYIGREAVERARGEARSRWVGVFCPGEGLVRRGASLQREGQEIGTVTSSAFSPGAGATLCVARVQRDPRELGAEVVVQGEDPRPGRLAALPFVTRSPLTTPSRPPYPSRS